MVGLPILNVLLCESFPQIYCIPLLECAFPSSSGDQRGGGQAYLSVVGGLVYDKVFVCVRGIRRMDKGAVEPPL